MLRFTHILPLDRCYIRTKFIYLRLQRLIMRMPPQKHIIDSGATNNSSAAQTSVLLAKGVMNPDPFTNNYECRAGSIIGAINIFIDVTAAATVFDNNPQTFDWMVFFNINDQQTAPTCDDAMGSAGADLITQIWHQDMAFLSFPPAAGTRTTEPKVHSWRLQIKPPRAWSKLNRGDTVRLYFKANGVDTFWIRVRAIYKEYFP